MLSGKFEIQIQATNNAEIATINQPCTLAISFGGIMDNAISLPDVSLQVWNDETESWEIVPSTVNVDERTLIAAISRPATYALFLREATQRFNLYLPSVQR